MKRFNVTVVCRKQNTLGHLLYKRSPECEYFDHQDVIYKINCPGCNKCYIGLTRRKVRVRLKEHKNAIKLNKDDNAVASHVMTQGHGIDPFTADIIAKENKYDVLLAKESLLIDSSNSMNLTTGCANRDLVQLLSLTRP